MSAKYRVVFVTCRDQEEALKISEEMVKRKLAACTSIVEGVRSKFWWRGEIEEAEEVLLMVKTREDRVKDLISAIKEIHSYEAPEIIALPIIEGNDAYLRWIDESLGDTNA